MSNFVFPSDLGSNQIGHYMGIGAYKPAGWFNNGVVGQMEDSWAFYIPGGGAGTIFNQRHEYADVKLSRVGAGMLGVSGDTPGIIPGALASPMNPAVEVLFRNTELRQFQFTFQLSPSSEQEAKTLKDGIQKLRYHSAPRIRTTGLFFESPSEFTIGFYFRPTGSGQWTENPNMPRISKCVLREVEVTYNNDGEYSTFENGMPVSVQLVLVFREMRIIDKNLIDQGY